MKNVWTQRRKLRKAITAGDWVFWDHYKLSAEKINYYTSVYGKEPFQVMGVPYSFGHGWLVDIGRFYQKVTQTDPANLIKVGFHWRR
jgi:hypothetical protein